LRCVFGARLNQHANARTCNEGNSDQIELNSLRIKWKWYKIFKVSINNGSEYQGVAFQKLTSYTKMTSILYDCHSFTPWWQLSFKMVLDLLKKIPELSQYFFSRSFRLVEVLLYSTKILS
jgi:hypothetical protein